MYCSDIGLVHYTDDTLFMSSEFLAPIYVMVEVVLRPLPAPLVAFKQRLALSCAVMHGDVS